MRLARTVLLALTATHYAAEAASFDCVKAISPREHLICNTETLSKADQKLANLYTAKLKLLSPESGRLLQDSERSWFTFTDVTCGLKPNVVIRLAQFDTSAKCLEAAYEERLGELSQTGRFGPYVFVRVDRYIARPTTRAEENAGASPGFDTDKRAYLQIDHASGTVTMAWNRKARTDAMSDLWPEEVSENVRDVRLGLATHHLISVLVDNYEYSQGAAHGIDLSKAWNTLLLPSLRELIPSDLLGSNTAWKQALGDIAVSTIEEGGWHPQDADAERDIRETAIDPKNWFIRKDGIEFSSHGGGCYACTPRDNLISWDKLRPILSPAFIASLQP